MSLEHNAIALYNTYEPNGYNMTTGGSGTPGLRRSEADILKRSAKLKAYFAKPEVKAHFSAVRRGRTPWNKGKILGPLPEAVRQKLSAIHKGHKPWNKGRRHTPEAKAKMRAASRHLPPVNKGIPASAEHRAKISRALRTRRPRNAVRVEFDGVCYFTKIDLGRALKLSIMQVDYRIAKGHIKVIKD
jgi:hypothetical protein